MSALTGTRRLTRFAFRRERVRIPGWVVLFAFLVVSTWAQSDSFYATQAERDDYVDSVASNPGLVALFGDPESARTVGGDVAWQLGLFGAVIIALLVMFIVVRHTRAEEQSERSELVRSAVVGRLAPAVAAAIVAATASIAVGAAVTLSMIGLGEDVAGSVAVGAQLGGAGLAFTAVTLLAAQLAATPSATFGMVGAALGAAYVLRAAGDVGESFWSWLSPLGWGQAIRPFDDERWWPAALLVGAAVLVGGGALALRNGRDEGASIARPRPGPARAGAGLLRPLGASLRLHRGALIGWSLGMFLYGVTLGLTAQDVEAIVGTGEGVELLNQTQAGLTDNYFAVSLLSLALIASGFAIQAVLKARREETEGRLELLLGAPLARPRWLLGHLVVAAGGTVCVLGAAGLGAGLASAATGDDTARLWELFGSALAYVPPIWVLIGATAVLFGLVPRAAAAAWGLLGACLALGILGPLLNLPQWALDLSPFEHVPLLPAEDVEIAPLLALTAVAAALAALALAGFRRRNVPVTG